MIDMIPIPRVNVRWKLATVRSPPWSPTLYAVCRPERTGTIWHGGWDREQHLPGLQMELLEAMQVVDWLNRGFEIPQR